MDRFLDISQRHDVPLIEDCAQAHLTRYRGRLAGTMGKLGAFSLQSSKHLQCGDGGITITDDEELGKRATLFVDKGCDWSEGRKYRMRYAFVAPCYRMTELQGAVLLAQLPRLPGIVATRQALGERLRVGLQGVPGVTPPGRIEGSEHSYWGFPILVDYEILGVTPQAFAEAVGAEGVPMGGAWPGRPLYLFEALQEHLTFGSSGFPFGSSYSSHAVEYGPGLCPRAELAMAQMRTVGINERYSEEDVDDIIAAVRKVAETLAARA
jgi:dTDP-4-amino-4,6-dideoxygalactose transaminase